MKSGVPSSAIQSSFPCPTPRKESDDHESYSVGGAAVMFFTLQAMNSKSTRPATWSVRNFPIGARFPTVQDLADFLRHLNGGLCYHHSIEYASLIVDENDAGRPSKAWKLLDAALTSVCCHERAIR